MLCAHLFSNIKFIVQICALGSVMSASLMRTGFAYLIMMVTVQDPLHILTDYSDNYEEIKVKLNEKYDVLKEQFGLVNFRMTDSKM